MGNTTSLRFPAKDPAVADLQHVTMRAGSLCIWDSRLPHDTCPCAPEAAARGRLIQYMKMASGADTSVEELMPYAAPPPPGS